MICDVTDEEVSEALSTTSVLGLSNWVAIPAKVPPSVHDAPAAEFKAACGRGPSLIWKALSCVPIAGLTCIGTSRKFAPGACGNCSPLSEPRSTSIGAAFKLAYRLIDALTLDAHDTLAPRLIAAKKLSCSVRRPCDETAMAVGCELMNDTRRSLSIHELYVPLARSRCCNPLAYVKCI